MHAVAVGLERAHPRAHPRRVRATVGAVGACLLAGLVACQSSSGSDDGAPGTGSGTTQDGTSGGGDPDTGPAADSGTTAGASTDGDTTGTTTNGGPCDSPQSCADQAEDDTAAAMQALLEDPDALREFLVLLPKGGDLHHHLSGSVYAETFMQWAREDGGYCIQSSNLGLSLSCGDGNDVPVPDPREELFLDVLSAWSMFGFDPQGGVSGGDHFFSTFSKFGAISGREHGRMLADVRRRAAAENVLYIEPMLTSNSTARSLGQNLWSAQGGGTLSEAEFAGFHATLLADSGFADARNALIDNANESEAEAQRILGCAGAGGQQSDPACGVSTRFQAYISRSGSHPGVFAQMIAAYEAAAVESKIVGLNLVGPEYGQTALSNYNRQMAMLNYLQGYYTETGMSPLRLSLHAGEMTASALPSGFALDETRHVRKAVETAGAARVGHGVDITFEDNPDQLFDLLIDRGVMVEICLASNDIILGVSGSAHPVHEFLARGVPVALATDDQAVARSSLAAEFYRAVADEDFTYFELKLMIRTSLQYSFLTGSSLWTDATMTGITQACAPAPGDILGTQPPTDECDQLLFSSDRANLQFDLELLLASFEAGYAQR